MEILERKNIVTLSVDLDNFASVKEAMNYLRKSQGFVPATGEIVTSKIKLIKVVRAFGEYVAGSAVIDEDDNFRFKKGLKEAKFFVEKSIRDGDIFYPG